MISEARPSARQRGYITQWDKARAGYLRKHPLCAMCLAKGRITSATLVDHITPHKGNNTLFWDSANWQSLDAECHNRTKQSIERTGYDHAIGDDGWPLDANHPANRKRKSIK